jgi:hypothetical protein
LIIIQTMENELCYLNPEGNTIFTSKYLKNRGTCCKSACLHCPFGYTIKKLGIQFSDISESQFPEVDSLTKMDWKSYFPEGAKLVLIKGVAAGVLLKNHLQIKHLFLRKEFQNQNISKELIEAYLF